MIESRERYRFVAGALAVALVSSCTGSDRGAEPAPSTPVSESSTTPPSESTTMPVSESTTSVQASIDDEASSSPLMFGAPSVTRLTPTDESWIDPEILAFGDEAMMAWQEPGGSVMVATLDVETGEMSGGSQRAVATDAASARSTFNGPEFGVDEDGWSLSYTRAEVDGNKIAIARPDGSGNEFEVETIAGDEAGFSPLASQVPDGATTRVLYLAESSGWGDAQYLDLSDPGESHDLMSLERRTDADVRWVTGTYLLATNNHPEHPGALALVATETHSTEAVSAEAIHAGFPYGWIAPDAPSEIAVLGVVDETQIVAWAGVGGEWQQWRSLTSPDADYAHFGSPEPFVHADRSFASFVVAPTPQQVVGETDQQVWLMSLDGETSVRCDDGREGPVTRVDPEVLVVGDRVFVYYYVLEDGESAVFVCSVDLVSSDAGTPIEDDIGDGPVGDATSAVELRAVSAEATDPRLETINGDHLVHAPSSDAIDRLLVWFPGTGAQPDRYEEYLRHAGALGLHVIGLGYDNLESVNFELCPRQPPSSGCHEDVRREILFGEPSGYTPPDVTAEDSAVARLRALLEHLAATEPDADWEQYLDPADEHGIAWSALTVAGHSQGGGHAAYLATDIRVDRVILFGATEPQPWTQAGTATPSSRYYALAHVDEGSVAPITTSWENLEMPGDVVVIEDATDGFDVSQRFHTRSQACSGDPDDRGYYHNCYIVDEYLPVPAAGQPHFADIWTHTLLDPI